MKNFELLSSITHNLHYAKFLPEQNRKETYRETVDRNKNMHIKKFAMHKNAKQILDYIKHAYDLVYQKKVLPSMRSLQYAGDAIESQNIRIFNCSFRIINDTNAFHEIFYLLLMGCGVGISVQKHHIEQLDIININGKNANIFFIEDTAEGWCNAIRYLFFNVFVENIIPTFNYSKIRAKGSFLKKSGGFAPGPEVLEYAINEIIDILLFSNGRKLKPIECHSIVCHIAKCVLSGGNRRSAIISLFSEDDNEMLNAKNGNWFDKNPHFYVANNSIVIHKNKFKKNNYDNLLNDILSNDYGEPGFFLTNNFEVGCNPCGEASLNNKTCCNLTTINVEKISSYEDAKEAVIAAVTIGTLQASYTDDNYLGDDWNNNLKEDSLLGVGFTGICSNKLNHEWLDTLASTAKIHNKKIANLIGIKNAKRIGLIKPEGTSSCLLGTSSGIHPYHSNYYIRRIRINKMNPIANFIKEQIPNLIENCVYNENDYVLSIPLKAPSKYLTKEKDSLALFFERIKTYYTLWIKKTHLSGDNTHNISCTIDFKENEKESIKKYIFKYSKYFHGLTLLKVQDKNSSYKQTPFESINKEQYNNLTKYIQDNLKNDFVNCQFNNYIENDFLKRNGCDNEKCSKQ